MKEVFNPVSPYVSKLYSHFITKTTEMLINYLHVMVFYLIMKPKRGETFVTKIVKGLVNIKYKKIRKIYLGNIYSKRDWGHASDYVEAMWLMLQKNTRRLCYSLRTTTYGQRLH